jgi:hypothetical protein
MEAGQDCFLDLGKDGQLGIQGEWPTVTIDQTGMNLPSNPERRLGLRISVQYRASFKGVTCSEFRAEKLRSVYR